jgi:hypothetical protein
LTLILRPFSGPKYSFPLQGCIIEGNIAAPLREKCCLSLRKTYNREKGHSVALKRAIFLLSVPITFWLLFSLSVHGSEWHCSLKRVYVTEPVPYPAYFNPEDGVKVFFRKFAISPQDCKVLQRTDWSACREHFEAIYWKENGGYHSVISPTTSGTWLPTLRPFLSIFSSFVSPTSFIPLSVSVSLCTQTSFVCWLRLQEEVTSTFLIRLKVNYGYKKGTWAFGLKFCLPLIPLPLLHSRCWCAVTIRFDWSLHEDPPTAVLG